MWNEQRPSPNRDRRRSVRGAGVRSRRPVWSRMGLGIPGLRVSRAARPPRAASPAAARLGVAFPDRVRSRGQGRLGRGVHAALPQAALGDIRAPQTRPLSRSIPPGRPGAPLRRRDPRCRVPYRLVQRLLRSPFRHRCRGRCRAADYLPGARARVRRIRHRGGFLQADAAQDRARRAGGLGAVRSLRRFAAPAAFARHHAGIRLETMRRDFVANVSHELRTPLTVLVGFLETVRELKLDPGRSRDYLNLMAEQSKRMQRIIEDLLTLSTLESAAEPPRDERVDVALLLSRIQSEAIALSAGRQRITLDAEPGFDLVGAESEIASAFGNLASNAVRYTPPGGEVRLIWRSSQKGAEFTVEDTGVGIEAEHIPRLTERFYRVDRGRSRETGGTGLGLAIVKHALARHQATLEIESTPGTGSRFAAKFPARRVIPARTRTANDALL